MSTMLAVVLVDMNVVLVFVLPQNLKMKRPPLSRGFGSGTVDMNVHPTVEFLALLENLWVKTKLKSRDIHHNLE